MKKAGVLAIYAFAAAGLFALGTYPSPPAKGTNSSAATAPGTAEQFYAAGYKAATAGNFGEAISDFTSAIDMKADYAEAYNMLAYSQRMTGDIKNSMNNYVKALSLKPDFPQAREYYGEAFLMDNNLNGAVAQYIILEKARRREASVLLESISKYLSEHPNAQS